jgi:hypothetical protein
MGFSAVNITAKKLNNFVDKGTFAGENLRRSRCCACRSKNSFVPLEVRCLRASSHLYATTQILKFKVKSGTNGPIIAIYRFYPSTIGGGNSLLQYHIQGQLQVSGGKVAQLAGI